MPEYTNNDRQMIEAEQILWSVQELLNISQSCGAWQERIKQLRDQCQVIARELREYNDQFEVEE